MKNDTRYARESRDIQHIIPEEERKQIECKSERRGMIKIAQQVYNSGLISKKDLEIVLMKNGIQNISLG